MQLAVLMVLTPDLAEARRFYEGVLGFDVLSATDDLLELANDGVAFHVYRCDSPAQDGRHGRDAGTTAVFGVTSLDETMATLRRRGVTFLHAAPASNRFGRYAAFRAPGGNIHEIFQAHA